METYTYKLVEDENGNIQCGDKLYRFEETIEEDIKGEISSMNKIRIIDLLNKIANGEEVPYRIKYNGRIYEYTEEIKWYLRDDMKCELNNSKKCLNDKVEILEEEHKIPEKIPLNYADDRKPEEVYEYLRCSYNQLIDYLKSKGE